MNSKDLESQSPVKISRWVDVNSEECRMLDDNMAFTKKCIKIGFEDGYMFTDELGRIWCNGNDGTKYPFHFEVGQRLYGYRLPGKAVN